MSTGGRRFPDWGGFGKVLNEQLDDVDRERRRVPVACPNDGEPLQKDAQGRLHCRFDGWTEDDEVRSG